MRTLPYDLPILDYLAPIVQAIVSLRAHPLTAPLAAEMLPLREEWKAVLLKEVQLQEDIAEGDALVLLADFELDALFNAIVNALKTVAKNNPNAQDQTSSRFLGSDRPSDVSAPLLGEELSRLRTWPSGLAKVPSVEVKRLGAELDGFVPKADDAVGIQTKANEALANFTQLGERKAFVDHLNAVSKRLYGKVSELMHTPAGASLPPDFPDRCFPPEARARRPTIKGEERVVERLKAQLARHEAILAELKKNDEDSKKAREDAEKDALQSEADALKKEAAEKLARAAELEAKLGKKDDGDEGDGNQGDGG